MALYVIGDLHLSLSTDKPMDIFGERWENYVEKMETAFSALHDDDLLVLPGDISWGMSLEEALADLQWIDRLPGRKLLLKGNHDYWWGTVSKMRSFLAAHDLTTIDFLHNNAYFYRDYALCGTRGWFYEEEQGLSYTHTSKILAREVQRLEMSFAAAGEREILCFLHYPPLYQGYSCDALLDSIDRHGVHSCFYGHLHGAAHRRAFEGKRGQTTYSLVAADYLHFIPKKICD